ncbi:cytochrome P450, partial [Lactarius vividus]
GPIFSFKIGTKLAIVLNGLKATSDLLDKKGDIDSSRPRLVVAYGSHDILSGGKRGLSAPYGDHWRRWHKLQHIGTNERAAMYYREQQTLEAAIVLRDLLADGGNNHEETLRRFVTSVVLEVSYGCRVRDLKTNKMVSYNYKAILGSIPGKYIVETWPSLLWLPVRTRHLVRDRREIRANDTRTYLDFFNGVKRRLETGIAKECMGTYSLSKGGNQGMTDVEVAYALSAPFSAGVDTVHTLNYSLVPRWAWPWSTTILISDWPIVAVVTYPDITTRIQEELNNVVGRDRLPTFDDEGSLPYLVAFIKEVTRRVSSLQWRPVVPLVIPHTTSKSDVYVGYDIPAGTTVYGNIEHVVSRTIPKHPSLFEDPETFSPSRFLKPLRRVGGNWGGKVEGEFTIPFGFGRHVCPGIHIAFVAIPPFSGTDCGSGCRRILWAFDVRPAADKSRVDPTKTVSLGLTRMPVPFYITVSIRHEDALRLIENESRDAELKLREWEY